VNEADGTHHGYERALENSERHFRLLVEGVLDYAIYLLDPSGIVTNWNSGAERMKGYTADEIVGQHFSIFYTKEDRASGRPARVLETAAQEGRYESEGWRVRKDGGRFWASVVVEAIRDSDGTLIGYGKITQDITGRRAAQIALRESERQFRLLVTAVKDHALYMIDPNGIVTSWNAGAETIKGYTADEILGQHFSQFYTLEERAAGVPAKALQIAMEKGRFETEGRRVRKNGTSFLAHVVIQSVHDENNVLVGFAKITRDITEQRAAALALEEAHAQRAQAQKMEALGQLTGGVAHDFNNLLTIINSQTRALRKMLPLEEKLQKALESIDATVQSGSTLTRQLLTFARRQVLNPVTTNISRRLQNLNNLVAGSLGAVRVAVNTPADLWSVTVDQNEFDLAVMNLVFNARDAMSGNGAVTIDARNVDLDSPGPEGITGAFVAVTVSDTGSGISPDLLSKVFDPFFTTKPAEKGSGLGLSQVHGFAHQSGGVVAIESEVGKGTQVTLYLPKQNAVEPVERSNLLRFPSVDRKL
jgi:PAS domain S-box-containing protein